MVALLLLNEFVSFAHEVLLLLLKQCWPANLEVELQKQHKNRTLLNKGGSMVVT